MASRGTSWRIRASSKVSLSGTLSSQSSRLTLSFVKWQGTSRRLCQKSFHFFPSISVTKTQCKCQQSSCDFLNQHLWPAEAASYGRRIVEKFATPSTEAWHWLHIFSLFWRCLLDFRMASHGVVYIYIFIHSKSNILRWICWVCGNIGSLDSHIDACLRPCELPRADHHDCSLWDRDESLSRLATVKSTKEPSGKIPKNLIKSSRFDPSFKKMGE